MLVCLISGPDILYIWTFLPFKNVNFCFIVDRLTGFIQVEKTPNQGTESAILAVRRWSSKFGFPYKIIADGGGGSRGERCFIA